MRSWAGRQIRDHVWSWECKMRKHTVPVLVKIISKNETDKNICKSCPIKDIWYRCILCKRTERHLIYIGQRLSGLRWHKNSDVKTLYKLLGWRVEEKCSRQRKLSKQRTYEDRAWSFQITELCRLEYSDHGRGKTRLCRTFPSQWVLNFSYP